MIFNIQNATIHQTTTSTTTNSKSKLELDLESKVNELEARLSKLENFLNGSATIPTPTTTTTNVTIEEPTSDIEPDTNVEVSDTIDNDNSTPTSDIEIKIEDDKIIETTPTIIVPEDDEIINDDILEEDDYTIPSTVLPLSDSYNAYVEQFKLESSKKATKKAVSIYILNALKEKYYDNNPDIFDGVSYNKFNSMSGNTLYILAEDIHNQIMVIVNNSSSDTKIEEPTSDIEHETNVEVTNTNDTEIEEPTSDIEPEDLNLEELENFDSYDLEPDTNIDVTLEELEDYDNYDLEEDTTISDIDYNAEFEEFKSTLDTEGKCDLSAIKWSDINTFDKLETNMINDKIYFRFGTRWKLDLILSDLGISLDTLKKLDDDEAYYKIICTYFAKVQDTNVLPTIGF